LVCISLKLQLALSRWRGKGDLGCLGLSGSICQQAEAEAKMIQFVVIQNLQGRTRLSKWYTAFPEEEKHAIEREVHRLVATRDLAFTNFLEVRVLFSWKFSSLFDDLLVRVAKNCFLLFFISSLLPCSFR